MELKVQPLQNQPTLNPQVQSSPTGGLQPPLRVAPAAPTQQIQVQRAPQPQGQITSIGTATQQQPYDQLKTSISNLDPNRKQELSSILARGVERGLTQDQMRQVADAYIQRTSSQAAPQIPAEEEQPGFVQGVVQGITRPFLRAGSTVARFGAGLAEAGLAVANKVQGDEAGKQYHINRGMQILDANAENDLGYFGKIKPYAPANEGASVKEQLKAGLDIAGGGVELGSYFVGAPGVKSLFQNTLKGQVLKGFGTGAAYGAAGGALGNFGAELQRDDKTWLSVVFSPILGGIGGGIIGGGIGAVSPLVGKAFGAVGRKFLPSVFQKVNPEVETFNAVVDTYFPKAFRPSTVGKKTEGQLEKEIAQRRLGVATVLDSIKEGDPLPQNLEEALAATSQAKKKVFENYNQQAIAATGRGAEIPLDDLASQLERIANDPRISDVTPGTADYARSTAERLRARGKYDPTTAQDVLESLNARLQSFYRNPDPNSANNAFIDNFIANNLRKGLDDVVSSLDAPRYKDLRLQYGALSNLEKTLTRRVQNVSNRNLKGFFDFADVISAADLVDGIITLSPVRVARGLATKGVGRLIKYTNDPDRLTAKLFNDAAKSFYRIRNEVIPRTSVPPQKLLPPGTGRGSSVNVPIEVPPGGFRTNSATESIVGRPGTPPLRRIGGIGSRRSNRLGGIGKPLAGRINPATNQLYALAGGVSGVEIDENGEIKFNNNKALAGVAVLMGIRSPEVISVLKSFSKAILKKVSPQIAEILTKLDNGEMAEKEAIAALKQLSDKAIGGIKKVRGGIPEQLPQSFETEGFNVGLTNVAGKGTTQSDVIMQEAKALYESGKFAEAQLKYNEAVNFGVNKVKEAFADTGIKIKARPGFGVFEGNVEPNIDLTVTVPKGKEDLFHAKLAEVAGDSFNQYSTISYRSAAADAPLGLVDEARQVYNEPIIRFTFKEPATVADVKELNRLMSENGIVGGSFKDNGRTLDIINLSHYNKDYENFTKQLTSLTQAFERKGLLERISTGVAETRHIGADVGDAPITYKSVQSEFRKQNPDFKPRGTQASRSLTSKVLDRLPLKDRVSKSQVEQLLKSQDIPAAERELVSSILSKEKDTIKVRDLEYKIRKNLLNTKPEEIDKWADYGMSNLNIRYENPTTIVLRTPVKHGVSGHFGVEDDFGHIRIFEKENYSPKKARHISDKTVYVAEIQADAFQRGLQMEKLSDRIDRYKGALDFTQKRVKELEDDLARNRKTENPERIKELENDLALAKLRANHEEAVFRLLQQREVSHGQTFVDKDVDELLKAADNIYTLESRALTGTSMTENLDFLKERLPLERENFAKLVEAVKRKPDSQEMAKQMIGFEKGNKYRKRMLEETLVTLQDKGYKEINLPTPSTVARVEWGKGAGDNVMPYEVLQGDPDRLDFGDIIDYGGEEMMVIDTPDGGIRVAPKDDVRIYDQGEWADSTVDSYYSEAKYELEAELKTAAKTITPQQAQELIDEGKVSWETEMVLQKVAEGEENLTPENLYDFLDKADDEWRNRAYEDEYDDMQGVFSEIYTEERGGGAGSSTYQRYYAVEDGSHTEVFDSPDNYDTPAGYDPETIDKDKSEAEKLFSKTEMGVLDNYYDLQKNLKEIQKRTDIKVEYVREEDNNGEPLTWIRVIPNKNLKKTAF